MPPVIGSRRRARATAGTSPVGRVARTEHGRRRPAVRAAGPSATSVLTVVGIGLGASLIFASLAVGGGVERSVAQSVEVTLGRSDFRLSAPDGGTLSQDILVTIRSVLGVEVAAPSVELAGTLLAEDDTAAPSGSPVTLYGIDPVLDGQIRDLDLVAGDTITRPDEAAAIITERLATEDGYELGSEVILATPGEPERFRVIGISAGDGPVAGSDGRTVILPISVMERLFGIDGVARVDLLVSDGVPLAGVRAELGEVLAGQAYELTSPADLAETLRLPTSGFAVTAAGIAAVGVLAGALLVFSAVRVAAAEEREVPSGRRVRDAAVRGAIGSGLGAVFALVLAVITWSDVAPPAVGLGGIAAVTVVTVVVALAAAAWRLDRFTRTPARMLVGLVTGTGRVAESGMPRSRKEATRNARAAVECDPAGTARTVSVVALALALLVAVAFVGANAHRTADDPSSAAVLGRVVAQIDALGLLAVVVAGLVIAATFAIGRVLALEAGILGLAGAVLGSLAGLAVGAVVILLGSGRLEPLVDFPWVALALCLGLGVGLSTVVAWCRARLVRRPSVVRAVQSGH